MTHYPAGTRRATRARSAFLITLLLALPGLISTTQRGAALSLAPATGGLGVPTGGLVTTLFLEPISYETGGSYYDQNNQPQSAAYIFHHGIDVSGGCVAGAYPVYVAAPGTVALAQYVNDGYGTQVAIDNGYNVGGNGHYTYTFYSHMGNRATGEMYIEVSPGQHVEAGDLIGYQGNDGSVYGSCQPNPGTHLDWEVRVSNAPVAYGTSMRYNTVAASPDFYTEQQITYDDPSPESYVVPGPFGGPGPATPTPLTTPTPGPCGMNFSDLPASHWAYQYVAYLYCRGIVSGYGDGTFRPGNPSTRAQFTKMVVLGQGWSLYDPYFPSFSDVAPGSEFYQYIETAHLRDIIGGYDDGTFRPGNSVTRAQATKMLVLAHGWAPVYPPTPIFSDVPTSHWAYGYVGAAVQHRIVGGRGDGTFGPENVISRAELCKMLALTLQQALH